MIHGRGCADGGRGIDIEPAGMDGVRWRRLRQGGQHTSNSGVIDPAEHREQRLEPAWQLGAAPGAEHSGLLVS